MQELLRTVYYKLTAGRIVTLDKPAILSGRKWKIDPLAGRAYWKGYYEPAITQLIVDTLQTESVFFDVGANVGYFSLLAAAKAPQGQVHSFEPDPSAFAYSQAIRQLNDLPNWTLNPVGVGERTETLFYQTGPTSTTGVISHTGGRPVPLIALDEYVGQHQITRLDLIKIDVEGFGGNVLRGACAVIRQLKPTIIMEFHRGTEEYAVFDELVSPYYHLKTVAGEAVSNSQVAGVDQLLAVPR